MSNGWNVRARDVELIDSEQRALCLGHASLPRGFYRRNQEHVGRVRVQIEPIGDVLAQYGWSERAKALAVFHLEIEHFLHSRGPRIAEDRACTEGARTKLHAPLKPTDRLFGDKRLRRLLDNFDFIEHVELCARGRQSAFDFS